MGQKKRRVWLSVCVPLWSGFLLAAQSSKPVPAPGAAPTVQGSVQTAVPANGVVDVQAALAAMKANDDAKALQLFARILAADSNNAQINLLAAGAAINTMQPELALKYAEKVHQLDPNAWQVHLTLVVADAQANRLPERDQERALIRQFHKDGKYADAKESNGFMVDYFPVKNYRVRAIEYFSPAGKEHFSYRFLVYDQQRKLVWTVALESDDLDQASWAAAHAPLAAQGKREYSLDGYGKGLHITYRSFSGEPSYDETKAEVVKALTDRPLPVAPGAQP